MSETRPWPALSSGIANAWNRVTFPNDAITTLEANEHVEAVELDAEVRTQQ